MCSIADTAIHGYQGIAHTTELRILAQVQYCGYRILYCGYRIHTHPRAVHVHAYSRTQHTTASPHLTHSSSSTPNLLVAAKSALPHPFPLTNIGHACPSRLIAETYTSHDHSLTVLLTLESCSSRVTVSISGGKVTPNFAYNTLFEHHGVGYATLGGHKTALQHF